MYEDAKLSKKNIYTAYSDFKGAFGGMDHRILFATMRIFGFPESYIQICEQLYSSSTTCYMLPIGNTPQQHIHKGNFQGGILFPFLFIIFIEPLLRWLAVGSRG